MLDVETGADWFQNEYLTVRVWRVFVCLENKDKVAHTFVNYLEDRKKEIYRMTIKYYKPNNPKTLKMRLTKYANSLLKNSKKKIFTKTCIFSIISVIVKRVKKIFKQVYFE